MRKIYYRPDGYWCDKCDLPYCDHRSDDFGMFEVGYEVDEIQIDQMVQYLVRSERNM